MPNFSVFRELEKIRNLPGIKRLWESVANFGFRSRPWGRKPEESENPYMVGGNENG